MNVNQSLFLFMKTNDVSSFLTRKVIKYNHVIKKMELFVYKYYRINDELLWLLLEFIIKSWISKDMLIFISSKKKLEFY